jgi:glycosyltransferase involved in cell wall biosynthesis
MIRVLQVMSCRGWSSDAYWAGRLTYELQERGHQVTLVGRIDAERKVLSRLRALGVADLRGLAFTGRRTPVQSVRDLAVLGRLMGAYDVIHVHRGKEHWMAALANRFARRAIPLIRTRHIVRPVRSHAANRWLYGRATAHVVAVTDAIRRQYVASGLLPPSRVTTLLGGVDHRRFHPLEDGAEFRRAWGVPAEAPVAGVLGGLREMKGHRIFVDAARRVLAERSGARFLIVGTGPHEARIRDLIARLGLDRAITMVGLVPDPERAIAALDVAVYPSLWSDGMGRVVFEYMAGGRAIVASRVGVATEALVDGETAGLVTPGEPEPLARAIGALLADPDHRRRIGLRCRELVEARYSGSALAAEVEGLYERAIERSRDGVPA